MSTTLWNLDQITMLGSTRARLERVSAKISAGVTAVIGLSGAGKTSLLNVLVGFESHDHGQLTATLPLSNDRLPLFWVPVAGSLWPHLSVREHLRIVCDEAAGGGSANADREILASLDLADKADVRPDCLSEGERSRLAVGRALASHAAVLVMDEPLVHVDPTRLGKYWDVIRDHCRRTSASLVFATHSAETVLREADEVICLKQGRKLYEGGVDELYDRPPSQELAEFLGRANWLTVEEARLWLNASVSSDCCYWPEQIALARDESSPFSVISSRFAGSITEVRLRDDRTQSERRFFHRPSKNNLHIGDRVLIKICIFLMLFFSLGCAQDVDPRLAVREFDTWSMPPIDGRIPAPRSMTVDPKHQLYVLDDAGRVLVFDQSGQLRREWTMPDYDVGKPEGICIFHDGRIAVADTHYHRVVFFDESGQVLGMLGTYGENPGEFIYPVAIVQDATGNFYVGEYGGNDRIQKFRVDGEFVLEFGQQGSDAGEFQRPSGIAWHDGELFVADAFNNCIQVFSDSGEFQRVFGPDGNGSLLHYPYDIVKGDQQDLYVIEYGANRVSRFDFSGKLLGRYGEAGSGHEQFATPWGLTIDTDRRVLIADTRNRRIVELKL